MTTFNYYKKDDKFSKPTEPQLGDMFIDYNCDVYVYKGNDWHLAQPLDILNKALFYRNALCIYANPDNWIGNEFWAEGGGDPKRFANKALGKKD